MSTTGVSSGRGLPRVSRQTFTRLSLFTFIGLGLIVISGAAVRLTGSGLGCPDWPACYQHRLTASTSLHPLIEFSNRLVTVALVIMIGVTVVGAYLRSPRRRDLILLSWLLVLGVVGDAVLGGIVVYTKLNPYLVMVHMWLSLGMVAIAVTLHHRSRYDYSPSARADVASPGTRRVAWVLDGLFVLVIAAGTAVTGTGPHAGGSQGQLVAKRIPVALKDMVMAHSALAVAFVAMVLATVLILQGIGGPARLRGASMRLLVIGALQGLVGYLQFVTHLPPLLVELHVLGAVSLTIGVTSFQLAQVARDKEPAAAQADSEPAPIPV